MTGPTRNFERPGIGRHPNEGGARIGGVDYVQAGDDVALTLPGIKAIAGTVVRNNGGVLGVCFIPSRLRPDELRDLVTAESCAA